MKILLPSLAAALLALLVVLAWRVVASGPGDAVVTSEPHGDVQDPAREAAELHAPSAADRARAAEEASPEPDRSLASRARAQTVRLVVLDARSGAPVRGARVRAEAERVLENSRPRQGTSDAETDLDRAGRDVAAGESDEQGEVELEVELPAIADARSGGQWGSGRIDEQSESPFVIEIAPDRSVTVQTVGADGRPLAGVPVAMTPGRSSWDAWSGVTEGKDATALIRHVDQRLQSATTGSATIGLRIPTREPVEVSFELAAIPRETLRLALPPTGSFSFTVVDPTGRPVERALISVTPPGPHRPAAGKEVAQRGRQVEVRGGRAELPLVEVGSEWALLATSDQGWRPVAKQVAGPVKAGETVEQVLRFEQSFPLLVGRLVDERGTALARRTVRGSLRSSAAPDQPGSQLSGSSDESGRFRLIADEAGGPAPDELVIDVLGARSFSAARGTASLPAPLAAGENDLGTVRMVALPLLLSGRVVDEAGAAIAGAQVDAQAVGETVSGASVFGATSDAKGRFELHGASQASSFSVSALLAGYLRAQQAAEAGARNVEIVMHRGHELSGRLLLDEGTPAEGFLVHLQMQSSSQQGFGLATAPKRSGRFRLSGIPPGQARIFLRHPPLPQELFAVEDVLIGGAGEATDPRLDPIDLRGRVRLLAIDVVDPAGAPIARGSVVAAENKGGGDASYALQSGRARVLWRGQDLELRVTAEGYRTEIVGGVNGDRRVELRPALAVWLRLAPGQALPDPPVELVAQLVADAGSGNQKGAQAARAPALVDVPLGTSGEGLTRVTATGMWRVRLLLRSNTRGAYQLPCTPAKIEVLDQADEQVFVLTPDPALYAAALRDWK